MQRLVLRGAGRGINLSKGTCIVASLALGDSLRISEVFYLKKSLNALSN
jgi:hypothetical protein